MNRFNFKLQSVLEYKERCEDEIKQIYAEYLRLIALKKEDINNIRQEIEYLKMNKSNFMSVIELKQYTFYLETLEDKLEYLKFELKKLEEEAKEVYKKFLEINKEKRVLENLKEQYYQQYINEVNRMEQKQLDEFSIITHYRNRGDK